MTSSASGDVVDAMATNDEETVAFLRELEQRKGLNTLDRVWQGIQHIATCVDRTKSDITNLRGRLERFDRDLDYLQEWRTDARREHDRIWQWLKAPGNGPPKNGNGAAGLGTMVTARLVQVFWLLAAAFLLLIVFANPAALEVIRIIFGGTATGGGL